MNADKYNLSEDTIYSLWERKTSGGELIVCNKFWLHISPDYGGGLTKRDAIQEAERLYNLIASAPSLREENEKLKKIIETLYEVDRLAEKEISSVKAKLDKLKKIFEEAPDMYENELRIINS